MQSSSPKTFCRKLPSLEKKLSVFFCFVSVGYWTKPNGVSWEKLAGSSKQHSMCPQEIFFSEKRNFRTKVFFISRWDMGQKTFAFWQICLPRLCRNFILLVHRTFLKFLFQKLYNSSHDFLTLDRKKIQPWSRNTWPGSQYFIFTCPQKHLMETKIWESFEFFHQCRRFSHKFLAFERNFSCRVVSTRFYLLIGRFCWKKTSEKFIIPFFNILHFRT